MRDTKAFGASDATIVQTDSLYGAELGAGASVGEHVIEQIRSRGGFGVVYRASGPKGEPAAVKVLHEALLSNEAAILRFEQEVEVIRRIDHPNIVHILARGELFDGRPYVVMEWLSGETLDEVLKKRGSFRLETALSIAGELCSALSAAHAERVIHRDLKGSNVMLLPEGAGYRVKLLDFGVAKVIDEDTNLARLTRTGARVGTPSYMAPEQILGGRISPATDIYSLGVLLFEMLTGRLPFQGESAAELELLHLDATPPRAGDLATLPDAVSDVIQRCLAKSPAQRYASADELFEDLRAAALDPERQGSSLRTKVAHALGVYVSSSDASAKDEDAISALAAARSYCEAEGFLTAWAGGRSLLAAAVLPSQERAAIELRSRSAQMAARLSEGAVPGAAGLSARVHEGKAVILFVQSMPQIVGGDLLDKVNESASFVV